MNKSRKQIQAKGADRKDKKAYSQPKLVKHGKVETLTMQNNGISGPILTDK